MNTDTGKLRWLLADEKPKPKEVVIDEPNLTCDLCEGKGSVPRDGVTRSFRRRAEKKGVPPKANYYPCPKCGGY